ncbi:MAG: hypothetical protein PHH84_03015 [Oscillospiraceae bacterium]|nr:hypothetical protein [Oscillospiraceae bacterium]MDD4413652.1 hypothetical protein [Oscillospiraceae bacterium]
MDSITRWAGALCFAAVGCTAFQILAPKKGMGKIFRLLTAAFFLCCLASPLLSVKSIIKIDFKNLPRVASTYDIQEKVKEQFKSQVNAALELTARQTLSEQNIELGKIEANIDIDEDSRIYINGVVLYLDKQSRSMSLTAEQLMEERLGVDVTVMIIE